MAERRSVESVWDYPRPPAMAREDAYVRAVVAGRVVAETTRPVVIRETSHPPTFYVPPDDVDMSMLEPSPRTTYCEYKGRAHYYTLVAGGERIEDAAWYYPEPMSGYEELAGHVAFYAWALDEATVDGEHVDRQEGGFYGGWIPSWVEGPFKGAPGTLGW